MEFKECEVPIIDLYNHFKKDVVRADILTSEVILEIGKRNLFHPDIFYGDKIKIDHQEYHMLIVDAADDVYIFLLDLDLNKISVYDTHGYFYSGFNKLVFKDNKIHSYHGDTVKEIIEIDFTNVHESKLSFKWL